MDGVGFVVLAFSSLFAVIDPLGCIPFFSGLTVEATPRRRLRILLKALGVALGVLLAFVWFGRELLELFGITIPAFRIAGGVILFGIGLDMLQSRPRRWRTGIRSAYVSDSEAEGAEGDDPSVTPLAIPLLAGPGSITTVMVLQAQTSAERGALPLSLVLLVILALSGVILMGADWVLRRLGETGLRIIEKLMGLLVTVIAVQLLIDGVLPLLRGLTAG
jgi:multiple antibiotic resistance protein